MPLQNPFRLEELLAVLALEVVLLGMRRHVVPPVARRSEPFIAPRYGTLEGPLVRVRPDVDGEIGLLDETFRAHCANMAAVRKVVFGVYFEGCFGVERF